MHCNDDIDREMIITNYNVMIITNFNVMIITNYNVMIITNYNVIIITNYNVKKESDSRFKSSGAHKLGNQDNLGDTLEIVIPVVV